MDGIIDSTMDIVEKIQKEPVKILAKEYIITISDSIDDILKVENKREFFGLNAKRYEILWEISKAISFYDKTLQLTNDSDNQIKLLEKIGDLCLVNWEILKTIESFEKNLKINPVYDELSFLEKYNFIKKVRNY